MSESKQSESDELLNLKHAVDRHEDAINEDAADIQRIKEQLVLIKEALAQIAIATYRSQSPPQEEALRKLNEIITKLSTKKSGATRA